MAEVSEGSRFHGGVGGGEGVRLSTAAALTALQACLLPEVYFPRGVKILTFTGKLSSHIGQ